ncbi:SDR family NAD(P)-dependent oxidoreductase [Saccharothrix syringae]|uniref:SDR family NAD(P)-dependent oxidoreductase n=1 Tax=Saccharothrix syringae TaxID=103733 RepID=A0A5Q0H361_SACSY|nr:SDR family NAD(P)-dependent oxidoreductase [Saccharothrix syringae]QFZ20152.1 SDR family NAD(P)-dependent oxidoreductase [Saccharothrix syringae]
MDVAVVTGAARGFGLEIARRLRGRGFSVLLTDVDDAVVPVAEGLGGHGVVADVRDPAAHREVAARAAALGRLVLWVNNAGVLATGPAWEHDDAAVRRLVEVNVLGVVHGSRVAVEAMRGHGGTVLNVSSMSALGPVPGLAVYAACKAAVLNFGLSLEGDLRREGVPVRVLTCCPDAADTDMVRGVRSDPDSAILFSSAGGLLSAARVAERAVGMLDGRRLVRALPAHRAVMARAGAVLPSVGLRAIAVLRRLGERRRAGR